jgi:hypothetical protein
LRERVKKGGKNREKETKKKGNCGNDTEEKEVSLSHSPTLSFYDVRVRERENEKTTT